MNKVLPGIRESVEGLKERLRRESRAHQKECLQVLYLLKSGQVKSPTQAGKLLGASRRTVGE